MNNIYSIYINIYIAIVRSIRIIVAVIEVSTMNHLPSTEAAIIPTAATRETLRAKPVVVIPSILVHVTLPVVLRRRVAPIAIQHDIDAIEILQL